MRAERTRLERWGRWGVAVGLVLLAAASVAYSRHHPRAHLTGVASTDVSDPQRLSAVQTLLQRRVTLDYKLAGFDTRPAYLTQNLTFAERSGHWLIGSDSDFATDGAPSQPGIWSFGPISTLHVGNVLALGPRGSTTLRLYAQVAVDAIPAVSSVWGDD